MLRHITAVTRRQYNFLPDSPPFFFLGSKPPSCKTEHSATCCRTDRYSRLTFGCEPVPKVVFFFLPSKSEQLHSESKSKEVEEPQCYRVKKIHGMTFLHSHWQIYNHHMCTTYLRGEHKKVLYPLKKYP